MSRPRRRLVGVVAILGLVAVACGGGNGGKGSCGLDKGTCRPESERVDRTVPAFSRPTEVRNPLFPASALEQVIQLGSGMRTEVTRLPQPKTIEWNGTRVETVVTQFVSYSGRRIEELALDYVGQGDDGSVWYFGETVSNYRRGVVANMGGSWLAGKDGPPGMLMPAQPKVGDVYRPENIPGKVFEEDTVLKTGGTVDGPRGPVSGVATVRERLKEAGEVEEKTFAPGYGEMSAGSADEHIELAVAVPTDSVPGAAPPDLEELWRDAAALFDVRLGDMADGDVTKMKAVWERYRAAASPPRLLAAAVDDALGQVSRGWERRDEAAVHQGAVTLGLAASDLLMRHRSVVPIDVLRIDVWARQLLLDAGRRDDLAADASTLEAIRPRLDGKLDTPALSKLDGALRAVRPAVGKGGDAVASAARALRGVVVEVIPPAPR